MAKLVDVVTGLPADAGPDPAADYVMTYDDSDTALKKVLLGDVATAVGGDYLTWTVIQAAQLCNEVMNYPSMELADGALPEWWEQGANATLTEEDLAGEAGITETWDRGLKLVTTADGAYGYQTYTYADQPRVKAGRKLSAIFAVWSVGGKAARIRLQSSVGSLGVSSDTTTAAWTILKVENVTLDGTWAQIRCECDTGTAYFMPLGINIGAKAVPLRPRGVRWIDKTVGSGSVVSNVDPAGGGYTDVDLTAGTSPITTHARLTVGYRNTTTANCKIRIRRNGDTTDSGSVEATQNWSTAAVFSVNQYETMLDDGQIFEYDSTAAAGDAESLYISVRAYAEWE